MIDALLYAVRDAIRAAGMGYGAAECEIMESGEPPPRCGKTFVAVHGGRKRAGEANDNNLYELYGFSVTLTMRVTVPLDRAGDQQVARNVAIDLARKTGFDHKEEQLRAFLHMNWRITVLQSQTTASANDNLANWVGSGTVYGFCEPARYQGPEPVRVVGGEWFAADPKSKDMGLVSELRFDGAKRFTPQTASVGPFV